MDVYSSRTEDDYDWIIIFKKMSEKDLLRTNDGTIMTYFELKQYLEKEKHKPTQSEKE